MKGFIEIRPIYHGKPATNKLLIAVDKICVLVENSTSKHCYITMINNDFNDGQSIVTEESLEEIKHLIVEAQ